MVGSSAFRPPPLYCEGLVHDRPFWVEEFLPQLAGAPRPVRVLSPCVGLNAPERAARELQVPWQTTGDYDINPHLWKALSKFTHDVSKLSVGPRAGSVLQVPLADLDLETDGLVSGPPCPPFSSMGKRLIDMDPRASVFSAVACWILHLSKYGKLTWFILENVSGITKRKRGEEQSFAEWFIAEMSSAMPDGWEIELRSHNSASCCLPQSRPRCFFIGTAPQMRATPFQRRVLCAPLKQWPAPDIVDFLDRKASDSDWHSLTVRQQVNVLEQLERFGEMCSERPPGTCTVGIVDIARDASKPVDSKITVGGTKTLRTNCSHLWVLPSPEWRDTFGAKGRFLNRAEKCRIAGIVPSSLEEMPVGALEVAVGNTIPVPLVGVVMAPVLRAWMQMVRASESEAVA